MFLMIFSTVFERHKSKANDFFIHFFLIGINLVYFLTYKNNDSKSTLYFLMMHNFPIVE